MNGQPPDHCTCCWRTLRNVAWTVTSPTGVTDRICASCWPHVTLEAGGIVYPQPCPNALGRLSFVTRERSRGHP